MKTVIKTFVFIFLALLSGIWSYSVNGQVLLKSTNDVIDHSVSQGSTVTLTIREYTGDLQWQRSGDGIEWSDWEGQTSYQIRFTADEENWLRVAVTSGTCDPVYSETVHVIILTGPVVVTSEVNRIADTEAYAGGRVTVAAGNTVTGFGVCWNTEGTPTIDNNIVLDEEEYYTYEDFKSYLSGLEPNTTYYVRAFARTADETFYGNQLSFTTDEASGTITDERDQKAYKWIYIGGQKWMAGNLAYLPEVSPPDSRSNSQKRYYVHGYEGSDVSEARAVGNYAVYGAFYNWNAAIEDCPEGWHLPTDIEWKIMERYLGMSSTDVRNTGWRGSGFVGGQLKETGSEHWGGQNTGATNSTGFSALPGGGINPETNAFDMLGEYAFFWSATEIDSLSVWFRGLSSANASISRFPEPKNLGISVRCLKDALEANTPPVAAFKPEPGEGTIETRFMLDASACRDAETNPVDLEVRWDFDGDGTWDTTYDHRKITTHQFTETGSYQVKLEVIDSRGLTDAITLTIIIN